MNEPVPDGLGEYAVARIKPFGFRTAADSWRVFCGPLASAALAMAIISPRLNKPARLT